MDVLHIGRDRRPDGFFARLRRQPSQINSDFVGFSCSRSEENNAARSLMQVNKGISMDWLHVMVTGHYCHIGLSSANWWYCTPCAEKLTEHSEYEINCAGLLLDPWGHIRRQLDRRRLKRLCDEHMSATWEVRSEPHQRMTSHWKPGLQCRQQYGVVYCVEGWTEV